MASVNLVLGKKRGQVPPLVGDVPFWYSSGASPYQSPMVENRWLGLDDPQFGKAAPLWPV
jgi:hypothetical protein